MNFWGILTAGFQNVDVNLVQLNYNMILKQQDNQHNQFYNVSQQDLMALAHVHFLFSDIQLEKLEPKIIHI